MNNISVAAGRGSERDQLRCYGLGKSGQVYFTISLKVRWQETAIRPCSHLRQPGGAGGNCPQNFTLPPK